MTGSVPTWIVHLPVLPGWDHHWCHCLQGQEAVVEGLGSWCPFEYLTVKTDAVGGGLGAGTMWPQQRQCMEQPRLEHALLSIPCSTASCAQLVRCSYFSRVPISVGAGHVDGDCASSVGLVLGFYCFHLKNDWKSKIQHW